MSSSIIEYIRGTLEVSELCESAIENELFNRGKTV